MTKKSEPQRDSQLATSMPKTCKSMLQQLSIENRIQLNYRIQSLWIKNCNNNYEPNTI